MHEGKLNAELYPYINDKPIKKLRSGDNMLSKMGNAKISSAKKTSMDHANNPRLFAFVIGGLSHHEVVGISIL